MTRSALFALFLSFLLMGCPMSREAVAEKQARRTAARAASDSLARLDSLSAIPVGADSLRDGQR